MFEDNLKERYGLAIDRIAEIKENSEIEDAGLAAYFTYTAEFLLLVDNGMRKEKPVDMINCHWKNCSTGIRFCMKTLSGNNMITALPIRLMPVHGLEKT